MNLISFRHACSNFLRLLIFSIKPNNIKVIFSGVDKLLPEKVIKARDEITEVTKNNSGGILNVCLNYSGRLEIVDATKKIIKEIC